MGLLKTLFQSPRYRRYLILGHSSKGLFWSYEVWRSRVFPGVDRLIQLAGCTPSVHCRQITKVGSKAVKFGKLHWSTDDAAKWCHDSELTAGKSKDWMMVDLEIYCPPQKELIEKMDFPAIYIQVKPMVWEGTASKTLYDEAIHLEVRRDIYDRASPEMDNRIKELAHAVSAIAVYGGETKVRSLNSFESLVREDFVYRGILDDELPDLRRMKGKWSKWDP